MLLMPSNNLDLFNLSPHQYLRLLNYGWYKQPTSVYINNKFNLKYMKYTFTITFTFFVILIFAQQDPEAKKILDQFSKKHKSLSSFKANFTFNSDNKQNGNKTSDKGWVIIKGDKYKLNYLTTEMSFDGKYVYNYLIADKEVNISKPGKKKDDFFLNNPSKLFTIYSSDFKYQLLGETTIGNRNCYQVDLYPIDIEKKSYSIIKLVIDKNNYEMVSAQVKEKSGVQYTVVIDEFNSNIKATDADFVFDAGKHKGVEVIDLR